METLFRWIHLSDIHVGHGDAEHGWDQALVMAALRRDAAAQVKADQAPIDAIFVTGDIAFSGNGKSPDEYARVKAWLLDLARDAGVTPAQIFVVPGNHDVNRGADKDRDTRRLLESLRRGDDKIDTALENKGDRARLASRMASYLDFASDFAPACAAPHLFPTPEDRLFWVHSVPARGGLRVRIIGLNTSLLAADDTDLGKLRLGKKQLAETLLHPPIEPGEFVVVLSHHPLAGGWLADQRDVDTWIRNHTDVHLSGHVHEADSEQARRGAGGSFVRIVAGAVHGDRLPPGVLASHGYSFGAVVVDGSEAGEVRLRVWPRKWSPSNTDFRVDVDTVPDRATYAEHKLALELPTPTRRPVPPAPPTLPATGPSEPVRLTPVVPLKPPVVSTGAVAPIVPGLPPGPIEVFISACPEDEALRKELEKHLAVLRKRGTITIKSRYATGFGAGLAFSAAVQAELRAARIVLVLLSAGYLAWDYEDELDLVRARQQNEGALVIPILLSPAAVSDLRARDDGDTIWFEKLQRLPRNHKPVTEWPSRDAAFAEIAQEIKTIAEQQRRAST